MAWRELEKSVDNVWAKFNELYKFHPSSGMNNEIIPKEASTPYRESCESKHDCIHIQ